MALKYFSTSIQIKRALMIFYLYISQNTDYFLCVNISIDYDYSDENLVSIEDEHADIGQPVSLNMRCFYD